MKLKYLRYLILSADANSEKEAQKELKEASNRLKAFAVAFGLSITTTTGRRQCDSQVCYFTYIFTFELKTVCNFGSVLELAAVINAFAHFNAFKMGAEEVNPFEDEA